METLSRAPLTIAEANQVLRAVRVDRFPIIASYTASVSQALADVAQLEQVVVLRVLDRDDRITSLDVSFGFSDPCPLDGLNRNRLLQMVREALHAAVTHEMDECLLVDGLRVFELHAEARGKTPTAYSVHRTDRDEDGPNE